MRRLDKLLLIAPAKTAFQLAHNHVIAWLAGIHAEYDDCISFMTGDTVVSLNATLSFNIAAVLTQPVCAIQTILEVLTAPAWLAGT